MTTRPTGLAPFSLNEPRMRSDDLKHSSLLPGQPQGGSLLEELRTPRGSRLDAARGPFDARSARWREAGGAPRLGRAWRLIDGEADASEALDLLDEETDVTDWIGIELRRGSGEPARGVRYRVRFDDGSVRSGRLDEAGRAELHGVTSGSCEVHFPELPEAGVRRL